MPNDVFVAISADALHAKSKVYIGRALARKGVGDLDEYQLWASLAIELLGKSALAKSHPSLVVDPTHWQSLFVAAGLSVTTDVKTITAKTLFERLAHLVPRFDKTIQKFCQDIAERRNAELHSGDVPFKAMRLDAWEARYWHACDTILIHLHSSLERWLGAGEAEAPRKLLEEASKAMRAAVQLRVKAAKENFDGKSKRDRERLATEAALRQPGMQTALFKTSYDEIWVQECPACGCRGFMAGELAGEDISEEQDEFAIWEIVDREFVGEDFRCPVCELALVGSDEIEAAGLHYMYEDQQEREMDYEPDYGND